MLVFFFDHFTSETLKISLKSLSKNYFSISLKAIHKQSFFNDLSFKRYVDKKRTLTRPIISL